MDGDEDAGQDQRTASVAWTVSVMCPARAGAVTGDPVRRMARPSGCAPTIPPVRPVVPVFPGARPRPDSSAARHECSRPPGLAQAVFRCRSERRAAGAFPARRTPGPAGPGPGRAASSPRRRASESTRANERSDASSRRSFRFCSSTRRAVLARLQPVRDPHALHLEPDVAEHAAHEHAAEAQHRAHRPEPAPVPLANERGGLVLHEPRHGFFTSAPAPGTARSGLGD